MCHIVFKVEVGAHGSSTYRLKKLLSAENGVCYCRSAADAIWVLWAQVSARHLTGAEVGRHACGETDTPTLLPLVLGFDEAAQLRLWGSGLHWLSRGKVLPSGHHDGKASQHTLVVH